MSEKTTKSENQEVVTVSPETKSENQEVVTVSPETKSEEQKIQKCIDSSLTQDIEDSAEKVLEIALKKAPMCPVDIHAQVMARLKAGVAKTLREASEMVANEIGKKPSAVRQAVQRQRSKKGLVDEKKSKAAKKVVTASPETDSDLERAKKVAADAGVDPVTPAVPTVETTEEVQYVSSKDKKIESLEKSLAHQKKLTAQRLERTKELEDKLIFAGILACELHLYKDAFKRVGWSLEDFQRNVNKDKLDLLRKNKKNVPNYILDQFKKLEDRIYEGERKVQKNITEKSYKTYVKDSKDANFMDAFRRINF